MALTHEVLICVMGHTGDVIREVSVSSLSSDPDGREGKKPTVTTFRVDRERDAPFLTLAEAEQINRIAPLGVHYRTLQAFERRNVACTMSRSAGRRGVGCVGTSGLYVRALAEGVQEVLVRYRSAILTVEGEMLSDASLPLSHIHSALREYMMVLPALSSITLAVDEYHHGPSPKAVSFGPMNVLDFIHRRAASGFPAVRSAIECLQRHCHRVFFNQSLAWMLHGVLTDPYGEFFVRRNDAHNVGGGEEDRHSPHRRQRHRRAEAEEAWNTEFTLNLSMLPLAYFPPRLAQRVLFIGKAVNVLRRCVRRRGEHGEEEGAHLQLSDAEIRDLTAMWTALRDAPTFHQLSVQCAVDKIHQAVAGRLYDLVVRVADLPTHLAAIKDLLLLAKGDLFHAFIEESRDLMRQKPSARAEIDLARGPWRAAIRACGLEDKPFIARVVPFLELPSFTKNDFESLAGMNIVGRATHLRAEHVVLLCTASNQKQLVGSTAGHRIAGGLSDNESPRHASAPGAGFSGGVWCRGKKDVSRRFSTTFTFRAEGGAGLCGLSFVIQNHRPAAVGGRVEHVQRLEKTTEAAPVPLGFEGIPNSVAIGLELQDPGRLAGGAAVGELRVHASGGAPRTGGGGGGAASGGFAAPGQLSSSLFGRRLAHVRLADPIALGSGSAQLHTLRIDYAPLGDMADRAKYGLKVYFDDEDASQEPALSVPFNIPSSVRLDDGRAYVGICSHIGVGDSGGVVKLQQWRFNGRDNADVGASRDYATAESDRGMHSLRPGFDALLAAERTLSASSGWRGLGLEYRVDFPLHLILTQDALGQYNRVFAFLLRLRRVGCELERLWPELMRSRYRTLPVCDRVWLGPLWRLRSQMAFVVNNLETHFHVDVIEAEYAGMQRAMALATDFDSVRRAHEDYLRSLRRRCYLDVPGISAALSRLVDLCERFCFLCFAFSGPDEDGDDDGDKMGEEKPRRLGATAAAARQRRAAPPSVMAEHIPHAAIDQLGREFTSNASYLFLLLQKAGGAGGGPASTAELVLRLDFNRFMSSLAASVSGPGSERASQLREN